MRRLLPLLLALGACAQPKKVFKSWEGADSPVNTRLASILEGGEPVRIAVLGAATGVAGSGDKAWRLDTEWRVTEVLEYDLNHRFARVERFELVTRSRLERSLRDVGESLSVYRTRPERMELARRLEMTHVLWFLFRRGGYGGDAVEDVAELTLVDVRTGETLAEQVARRIGN